MAEFKSLKKPLLSKEVEEAIKKSIEDGVHRPGQKLPSERELVDQFQVSRVTIREALQHLQSSGLLTVKRGMNAGTYVAEPTAYSITENFQNLIRLGRIDYSHLIDARLYIEPRAAEIAARYRTKKDLQRLEELLTRASETVGLSKKEARLINVSFHCEVARISGNPIIVFITESVTQSYSELMIEKTETKFNRQSIIKLVTGHMDILDSIKNRNSDEAYEKTRQHLLETYIMYSQIAPDGAETDVRRRIRKEYGLM